MEEKSVFDDFDGAKKSIENAENVLDNLNKLISIGSSKNNVLDAATLGLISSAQHEFIECISGTSKILGQDTQTWFHKISEVYSIGKTPEDFLDNHSKLALLLSEIATKSIELSNEYSNYVKKYYNLEALMSDLQIIIYKDTDGDLDKIVELLETVIKDTQIHNNTINKELNQLIALKGHSISAKDVQTKLSKIRSLNQHVQDSLRNTMKDAQNNADNWHKKMQLSAISFIIPFVGAAVTGGFGAKYEHEKSRYNKARDNFNKIVATQSKQSNVSNIVNHIINITVGLNEIAQFLTGMAFFFEAQSTTLESWGQAQGSISKDINNTWQDWTLNNFINWIGSVRNSYYKKYCDNIQAYYEKTGWKSGKIELTSNKIDVITIALDWNVTNKSDSRQLKNLIDVLIGDSNGININFKFWETRYNDDVKLSKEMNDKCQDLARSLNKISLSVISFHSDRITSSNKSNNILKQNEYITSSNGKYFARMQNDGNFVVYNNKDFDPSHARWASNTQYKGSHPYSIIMQTDGNLCIYGRGGVCTWASNTFHKGNAPYQLIMQNDQDLCLYANGNKRVWHTNT